MRAPLNVFIQGKVFMKRLYPLLLVAAVLAIAMLGTTYAVNKNYNSKILIASAKAEKSTVKKHTNDIKIKDENNSSKTNNEDATSYSSSDYDSSTTVFGSSYNKNTAVRNVVTAATSATAILVSNPAPAAANGALTLASNPAPVAITPVSPVTPITPITPVSPVTPVTPVSPVSPVVVPPITPPVTPTPSLVAPTAAITAPVANATVSGIQNVAVNASDDKSDVSVSLMVDGQVTGIMTVAPYIINWDTSGVANGTHVLAAVATDSDNLSTTSASITVIVNNQAVTPAPPANSSNLIGNASVETSVNNAPTNWAADGYGTNDRTFTYETNGHSGSSSLKTTITSYSGEGDAKWFFAPVNVTAGGTYKYSNWYKSDVATQLNVMVTFADGTTSFYYLASAPQSADWAVASGTFEMPANAKTATVFQALSSVGYLQVDDFSFESYQPTPFSRALVSLSFDDGWLSTYTNGLPLLEKYNLVSTQYLLTSTLDYPDYMDASMIQAFKNQGSEIAAHTVNHCDLTGKFTDDPAVCPVPISAAQVNSELTDSKATLETIAGTPVTDFATPYGAYSADVIAAIKAAGYTSHRSTDVGYNSLDSFDPYNIKVQNVTDLTTVDQVKAWIDEAIANKTWLVIVYHEVGTTVADPTYAVSPANLEQQLAYLKETGVSVVTVSQALAEIAPQVVPQP